MKLQHLPQGVVLRVVGISLVLFAVMIFISRQAIASSPAAPSPDSVWREVDEATLRSQAERILHPDRYRVMALDAAAMQLILAQAPLEFTEAAQNSQAVMYLPLPDGGYGRFRLVESPIMAPELAAKFPLMKTYAGRGLDDPTATVRLGWTQFGFHATILSTTGSIYIDPYSRADTIHYLVYHKQDYTRPSSPFVEHPPQGDNSEVEALVAALQASGIVLSSGEELRTYRLAVAATGEYTIYHGGTVPDGMAAIVVAMNRVNGIYERDVAVRMELIANNDLIVYTDPVTDPYTNDNGVTMLGQNQANLDAVIGDANYDIGHVFSTGGGGVANLGVPCRSGFKARGVTGLPNPIGDPFYVDYVAHEMGHQYGANHTFNGNAGSCSGGNRNGSTAYEPGSGTTIMAYAGICGNQNIQANSDDDFHGKSFDEIRAYTVAGQGNTCPVITLTGNTGPTVNAGDDFTIPLNTPFILSGSAADIDGDTLTYDWEQFDLGPAGHPDNPVGNAPLFRSFVPVTVPYRIFPQISNIVNNTHTIGELLPGYARVMNFRLTVRDNNVSPSAGGVNYDAIQVTAVEGTGPFEVTAPNTAVTWETGNIETITWNVANTDQSPINCAQVDLRLSTDGGYTYPVLIEANRLNDGAENIIIPFVPTTQGRVQVICSDNIFFDISDVNFTILSVDRAVLQIEKSVAVVEPALPGDPLTYTITISNVGNVTATTAVTDVFPVGISGPVCNGIPGDLMATVDINPDSQVLFECTATIAPTLSIEIEKTVDQEEVVAGTAVTYTITITNPNAITLTNVLVSDPGVVGCTFAAITLAPTASHTYICANNVISSTTTNTATVSAETLVVNTATADAPEALNPPVSTDPVPVTVNLAANAAVTVTVISIPEPHYLLYLPVILKEE
ncbi:MAG TPA: M12 family metallo-peptidase [Chloroflexota bacterium]|nr:M12 family metallo-peptidase [Chloroflexota bacterium]HUM67878.1 M12 family metallo-peptidase [Chloroflexota bacterium]